MMSVVDRARASGRCPPSLLQNVPQEDQFESAVLKVLDAHDLCLASGPQLADDFESLLQMASESGLVDGDNETKKKVLSQRRCIILAIVGATPSSNISIQKILQNGFLSTVKSWMNDALNGSIGGVDLLLHLLTNVKSLPVTKSVVKNSGMGKAIGSIEKHSSCAGTPNEGAIKERVKAIKDAWNKSVKSLKEKDVPSEKASAKRELESPNSPVSKKPRTDEKKSAFSNLLKKVDAMPPPTATKTGAATFSDSPPGGKSSSGSSAKFKLGNLASVAGTKKAPAAAAKKKQSKRVKWSDHFGGNLTAARILEGDDLQPQPEEGPVDESSVSWSDRRRRDRLREKELLAKAKKSKIIDDDDDDMRMDTAPALTNIKPSVSWRTPKLLPERPDAAPPQVTSTEMSTQASRMGSVKAARYTSERDVPNSPSPLTDVEQALDMTSQSSTTTQSIPFFVPQAPPAPAPAAAIPPAPMQSNSYSHTAPGGPPSNSNSIGMGMAPPPQQTSSGASPEVVQSLGLPMFLVGQNVQALQTLAGTPSLLSTFVDSSGMYDQARLTSLVQTLTQNIAPSQQSPQSGVGQHSSVGGYQQSTSPYGPAGGSSYSSTSGGADGIYGPASSTGKYGPASSQRTQGGSWQGGMAQNGGYRGDQNSTDGCNLHIGGYGPSTTQTDIINLFSPYVKVDEVVMKGTFSFVNTSDAVGATRAREALTGALLGGQPIRINIAQRKNRDNSKSNASSSSHSNTGSYYGNNSSMTAPNPGFSKGMMGGGPTSMPGLPQGQGGDFENVRDDRGNPATKNLFVAGYGPGTSEAQLREVFGQHTKIIGIIMKGTFSFVNTEDKRGAIQCREMMSGSTLNGGVIRINFAKETGRLGTSFDLTYGSNASGRGGGGGGGRGGGGSYSHYGRGSY